MTAPLTPGGVLWLRWWGLVAVLALTVVVTTLAVTGLSVGVDSAVRDVAVGFRGGPDPIFRALTELGGGPVVIPLAAAAAAVTWRRCPPLGAAILLAVAARYGVEILLKEAIGRERPTVVHLAQATGFSFPSGHVLGATVGWGTVPAAVRAATDRVAAWRAAIALWALVVVLVAASRIYLGVHWFTDTMGSVLVGLLVLGLVDVAGGRPPAPDRSHPG